MRILVTSGHFTMQESGHYSLDSANVAVVVIPIVAGRLHCNPTV